jgi:GR25 family glycosyltransferase involved in LPS biosynthesis
MVKICLNMIVKNESHIIESTLTILSKYIDYWVISDTGSTDNTIEIIKNYFEKVNIPGELHEDEWEDFGTNRTKALTYAYNKCDYIWVFDADDLIDGNLIFPEKMDSDAYHLKFGKDFTYKRTQIFKSDLKWIYKGVLHEYPACLSKDAIINTIEGNYYVDSRRLGDRSKDPKKYLKDAETLIKGLEKDPEHKSRYLFYIGQSYKDYGDNENSIIWYNKRILEGGWNEELYISYLEIAKCLERLNKPKEQITEAYLSAHSIINDRRESLYYLGVYLKQIAMKTNNIDDANELLLKAYNFLYQSLNIKYTQKYLLFIQYDIYNWKNKFELAAVSNMLDKKKESKKLCEELLKDISIRKDLDKLNYIENLNLKNIEYNEEDLIKYPTEIINNILNNIKLNNSLNKNANLTLTITTCKRYDLFVKTINSFINCCKDINLIDRWVCIDDNSSEEDRTEMKLNYPFFEFYFKITEEKGHSISMNMIQDIVKSPFVLHLEDDWLFIEKCYMIKPALYILNSEQFNYINPDSKNILNNKKIMQVLFNKNYAEDVTRVINGGYVIETKELPQIQFLLHEHYPNPDNPLKNRCNCAYWPHYSFRPSIFNTEIFNNLGKYDNEGFFERSYADKYYNSGYLSGFYDKIISIHIGKKTWEKNVKNSYNLNDTSQFGNLDNNLDNKLLNNYIFLANEDSYGNDIKYFANKNVNELIIISDLLEDCLCFNSYGYLKNSVNKDLITLSNKYNNPDGLYIKKTKINEEIICLNLEFRNDRKDNMKNQFDKLGLKYNFFTAIDGKKIEPTPEIIELFKDNDFGSRVGIVGCALSHKNIWENLINEKLKNYYIILEDDVTLHSQFKKYLNNIQLNLHQIKEWDILFLGYSMFDNTKSLYNPINQNDNINISIKRLDVNNYIGGFYSYIISKSGAEKILKYINDNGIKHGIDYLIKIYPNLVCYQLDKFIVYTDWVQNINSDVDSDIQKNYEFVDIYSDENFKYFRGLDYNDNNIIKLNGSIDVFKEYALKNNNCDGFNTFGFMKSNINHTLLKTTPWYKNILDGIYIKRSVLEKNNILSNLKTRIKLLCNWCSSKDLCNEWNHMTKGNYKWNNIEITWEDFNIDFYVIINKPLESEYYDASRTIIFHMEPCCYNDNQSWGVKTWGEWSNPDENKFLQVRTHKKFINNCMWQLSTSYTQFMDNPIIKNEDYKNIISSICSSKYFDPGHIKRIDFLKYIELQNDPDVKLHIYNSNNKHNFKSYIGKANPNLDKDIGIIPYKYYFMCENNVENNFITEKIWEPLLAESLVFYWGCPNISDYINPLAYVELDMNDFEKSFNIIKNAINSNLLEQRLPIIREEKQKVLNYYNFFPTLERILFTDFNFSLNPDNYEIIIKKLLLNSTFENNNICFIHSCSINFNTYKLDYLINYISDNGILDKLDLLIINNIGTESPYDKYNPINFNKIKIINYSNDIHLYELCTIKLLHKFSNIINNINKNIKVLYLHTKGITCHDNKCVNDWINLMLYFLVNQHDNCIKLLDNYDSIGVNYIGSNENINNIVKPHWSGNFWWATTSWIKNLNVDNLIARHDAEWFILSLKNVKKYELYNSNINHYLSEYPSNIYIKN